MERLEARLASVRGRPEVTAEQQALLGARTADYRDGVQQLVGLYRKRMGDADKTPELTRMNALGTVTLVADSVTPNKPAVLLMLAVAVELLAEQAKETQGSWT
jgi:hypothetical protein